MKNQFKLLIVLLFNYFFVSSCNHVSPEEQRFSDALKNEFAFKLPKPQ